MPEGKHARTIVRPPAAITIADAPHAGKLHAAGVPKLYDPGLANTVAYKSSITLLDGPSGILRYRGYPIELLATSVTFDEVAYLLLYTCLPSKRQLEGFRSTLALPDVARLPPHVVSVIQAFPKHAHPMTILVASLAAFTAARPGLNPAVAGQSVYDNPSIRAEAVTVVLGSMPTLAATILRHTNGNVIENQRSRETSVSGCGGKAPSYIQRFFQLAMPNTPFVLVNALETLLILHADHEQNCSTAAVRHLTSSGVDVFSALSAGAAALYGPLHGGACEAVVRMLARIGSPDNVSAFLQRVKDRKELLMGFGHRVYKTYDPRARIVRKLVQSVLEHTGYSSDPLIRIATTLERAALNDDYFVSRKLYPNIDFYSGIIYKALGIEPSFFGMFFALGRCAGWLAHWLEYLDDPDRRIARPHQRYTGVIGPLEVPLISERDEDKERPHPWKKSSPTAKL